MVARRLPVPRWVPWALASALAVPAAEAQPSASAQLGSAALRYSRGRGADSCPDEPALVAAIIARLGYDPFHDGAPRRLSVVIGVDNGVLRATMELQEPDAVTPSTHRLVSARLDCATLHPALALAIALAIDPARALELDVGPAPPSAAPPPAWIPPPPPRTPARVDPPRARLGGFLYGGVLAAIAAAPTTTGGLELGGGIGSRSLSIALELRGDMPTRGASIGGQVELGRFAVQVVPCFRAGSFGLCGLGAVGVSIARGHGFAVSREVTAPYAAIGARLMAELPLRRRLGLRLHADVLGLITRLALRVDASSSYVDSPASGAFGIDVVGRFGDGS